MNIELKEVIVTAERVVGDSLLQRFRRRRRTGLLHPRRCVHAQVLRQVRHGQQPPGIRHCQIIPQDQFFTCICFEIDLI